MARKKRTDAPTIDDLVDQINAAGLTDGFLDGEMQDACDDEADLMFEGLKDEGWRERLQFLYMHGFSLRRLKEIIEKGGDKK